MSLFAAELEEPKIDIYGKGLTYFTFFFLMKSLADNKILDWSKFKVFVDNKINVGK